MHPLTDLNLARRLERAEGATNAALVDARAEIQPEVGAAWIAVGGVYAMYDGADSPLTQSFGLGLSDGKADGELGQVEQRKSPCSVPVSGSRLSVAPTWP